MTNSPHLTVERLAIVQPLMGPQPVPRVECFLAAGFRTDIRLDFRVNSDVNLLTVGGKKRFGTAIFGAFEFVFT